MASINKVTLIGNLGQDPEVRYLTNGNAVCNFSIATTEKWTEKITGKKHEKTEWHRVVVFGKLAELCGEYLSKGSSAYVEGKLQTREWQDKDGNDKYTTEVVVDMRGTVQFLSARNESDSYQDNSTTPNPEDDDIPF